MTLRVKFADSTTPEKIPSSLFGHVASYANGVYTWPQSQLARFPRHIQIGVYPGSPEQAKVARVLDVERFDATPEDFPQFTLDRIHLGHADSTAYSSILGPPGYGLVPLVESLKHAGIAAQSWRLWLAWWWQRPFPPTAGECLNEIRTLTGIVLPPRTLWACQWNPGLSYGLSYDESILYGEDDFTSIT